MGAHVNYTAFRAAMELCEKIGVDPEEGADTSDDAALVWNSAQSANANTKLEVRVAALEARGATMEGLLAQALETVQVLQRRVTALEGDSGGLLLSSAEREDAPHRSQSVVGRLRSKSRKSISRAVPKTR